MDFIKKFKETDFYKHETKFKSLIKYLIIVSIIIIYFIIMAYKYGIDKGFSITLLTWSFFVFCTPIADAGFLLDFPIRLITKIRMIYSEIIVWITASIINIIALTFYPNIYTKTFILKLFKTILINPYPYWSIIILSAIGTFLSIYFGDELIDVATHKEREKYHKHKQKYYLLFVVFLFVIIFFTYKKLLVSLGIKPFL